MRKYLYIYLLFFCLLSGQSTAQEVSMYWPTFAGKTYDFIIFQGDKPITAQQDTIPKDGRFRLKVPQEYAPYKGMCRWLITGTAEGGGLDMSINGYNFSISCTAKTPNENNIIYQGYDAVNELNRLNKKQMQIIEKHSTMVKAFGLYGKKHKLYDAFVSERILQEEIYVGFQKKLANNPNYAARFLPIVNITKGIGPKLYTKEEDKLKEIVRYFAYDIDIDALYTSGHWSTIIGGWVQLQNYIIKDDRELYKQFDALTKRVSSKKYYTDLTGKVTYYMKSYGMEKQIDLIAPIVTNSGKVTEYVGNMEVYI